MPVPKRKRSKARRDKRHANRGLDVKAFTQCSHCSAALATHQACKDCGFYKGKKVLVTKNERTLKRQEAQKKAKSEQKPEQEQ